MFPQLATLSYRGQLTSNQIILKSRNVLTMKLIVQILKRRRRRKRRSSIAGSSK
jgi:hypothetical protein